MLPHNPYYQGEGGGHEYETETAFERIVSEHTGLNFCQIQDLALTDWLVLRRDAFIAHLNTTEAGREYLDEAWRLSQTEPDREKLRQHFGRREDDA